MKVLELTARNYKRLRYVELKPEGELIVIGGRNAQGKSSLLDALADALSGSKTKTLEPVRKGEARADIVVTTDTGLKITKYYTEKGGYGLRVQTADGAEYPQAAAYLGQFFNSLTFDPLEFARADEKRQAATLRRLAGIDIAELDERRKATFDERTVVNRRVRDLEGELKNLGQRPVAGGDPVDVAALMEEESRLAGVKASNDDLRRELSRREAGLERARAGRQRIEDEIERLRGSLQEANAEVAGEEMQTEELRLQVATLKDPDIESVRARIATAAQQNSAVQAAIHWDAVAERLASAAAESTDLTGVLEEIDSGKLAMLRDATYPLPGLSVDAEGHVLYGGVPFSQASSAEQIKVSAACGLALKPELRMLIIRDGSLLDDDSVASLEELAGEFDAQIFIERVGTAGASIVIEDGEVRA